MRLNLTGFWHRVRLRTHWGIRNLSCAGIARINAFFGNATASAPFWHARSGRPRHPRARKRDCVTIKYSKQYVKIKHQYNQDNDSLRII